MNKKKILLTVLTTLCLQITAQDLATGYKDAGYGNPISPCVFCADPTALVYDGRLYVYGTNDHQQFIANGKKGENNYGAIKSLVIFSTDDMVNWTFHGTIDVAKLCSSWGWRFAASWAPSVTWRETADGKKEFFLYFANSGGSIGVITASSPTGPWKSPFSKPFIDGDTPGVKPCNWIFDPGVLIDDEGTGWIAFGGGDPNNQGTKLMPGNSRIAKLKSSMLALDGKAVSLPAPYLFEASELNMMSGKYVYTYNTSWSDRNDWNQYAKRGSAPAPSTCSMCYMVSDNPLDPDSWQYKGEYVANPGTFGFGYGNNHTHLQKFNGEYYLFYHSMVLEQKMKTGAFGFRSIGVNKASVNEDKQTIGKVTMTNSGVSAIAKLNPYKLQQAETIATAGGVSYEHFSNIKKNTTISTLGNDASENQQVRMNAGAWIMVRNVDFGTNGARSFMLRARGTGTFEIRVNSRNATPSATIDFSSTGYEDYTVDLDIAKFKGVRNIYFVFTKSQNAYFDAWQFTENLPDGITTADVQEAPSALYDLSGRRLSSGNLNRGIVIKKYKDNLGTLRTRKRVKSAK